MMRNDRRAVAALALSTLTVLLIGATTVAAQDSVPAPAPASVVTAAGVPTEPAPVVHEIVFPVDGEHRFVNDWYFPDDGGARRHWGIDIPAVRMTPLVAAVDGTITRIRHSNGGAEGNMVIITGADGWRYLYIHLNNDTPGTVDNLNDPRFAFAPGLVEGMSVEAGDLVGYVGDSGHSTGPHLHFAMTDPAGRYVNPFWSLRESDTLGLTPFDFLCRGSDNPKWSLNSPTVATPTTTTSLPVATTTVAPVVPTTTVQTTADPGDDIVEPSTSVAPVESIDDSLTEGVTADDTVEPDDVADVETASLRPVLPGQAGPFDGAPTPTSTTLPEPIIDDNRPADEEIPTIQVVVGGTIDISALGDAGFRGSLGDIELDAVVDIERTASGRGFYLLDRWGDVQEIGDAVYFGSLDDSEATGEAAAIALSPDGAGYWILAADGVIHPFGSAADLGSLASEWLTAPLVDLSPTPTGRGLVLVASDGRVFSLGDAPYNGSIPDLADVGLVTPVAVQVTATGNGYWILANNGMLLTFGDAAFSGSKRGGAACHWSNAVGVISFADGSGIWVVADDLQAWAFGRARDEGPLRAAKPTGSGRAGDGPESGDNGKSDKPRNKESD